MTPRLPHHVRLAACALCVTLALASCSDADTRPAPTPVPAPATVEPSASPRPTPAPSPLPMGPLAPVELTWRDGVDPGPVAGRSLDLPPGWTAEVWAVVPHARIAAWAPDGRLAVTTGDNGWVALITPGASGAAPTVSVLLEGLVNPQGIAFTRTGGEDFMVVGEENRLTAWTYREDAVSSPRVLVEGLPGGGHGAKGIAAHGDVVAYSLGSTGNREPADRTASPERAVVAQVRLDGTDHHVVATGVRNGFGLAFAPDGSLFTAVNQADNQPYPFRDGVYAFGSVQQEYVNENPVDQVTRLTQGVDLGWPFCFPDTTGNSDLTDLPYVADAEFNADGAALDCAALAPTQVGLPAHSAPLGLAFTTGTPLSDVLGDGALVGAHGSWNRSPARTPYVGFMPWDADARSLGAMRVVVTGFQSEDGSRWGRAVDAVPGPDGSLYVTDDLAGLVYRVTPPSA